jgi:hypothetical protein
LSRKASRFMTRGDAAFGGRQAGRGSTVVLGGALHRFRRFEHEEFG